MKRFLSLLTVIAFIGITNVWGTYTKITSTDGLSVGDQVIIATESGGAPSLGVTGGEVLSSSTKSKDATTSSAENQWMVFTVESATNGFYLKNSDNAYIANPGSNNTFHLTKTSGTKGICSINSSNKGLQCNSRTLCKNNGNYRMYSSIQNSYVIFCVWKVSSTPSCNKSLSLTKSVSGNGSFF